MQQTSLVRDWEQRFQSGFHLFGSHFKAPEAEDSKIVVVLINDQSLPEGLSRSPIDRRWLSSLIDRVADDQPALIGLNVLLDRTSIPRSDLSLANSLKNSGRVVIRSDPFYPPIPLFVKAALGHGTLRFKIDSSGAVQEICISAASCRSDQILLDQLLKHVLANDTRDVQTDWMRINFAASRQLSTQKRYVRFPVLFASELEQLPAGALTDKIVLIGTGFPDLYPLYRTPLPSDEQFLQETEILATALDMALSDRYILPLPLVYAFLWLLAILLTLSALLVRRGILTAFWFTVVTLPVMFFLSAFGFTVFRIEIPFVSTSLVLLLFLAAGTIQQILEERFTRLTIELKLKEAKIDFLTNELHTHHLFNELSRLNVMIAQHPESARAYLVEFAELLRASLKYGDQARVQVQVQMDYINTYLQQQAIILGEKFQFNLDIKGTWESINTPWHAFYPLVENAVKATEQVIRNQPDQETSIEIALWKEDDRIRFRIDNPYLPERKSESTRKGLANLVERLKWSYPKGGYDLTSQQQENRWISSLTLPLD